MIRRINQNGSNRFASALVKFGVIQHNPPASYPFEVLLALPVGSPSERFRSSPTPSQDEEAGLLESQSAEERVALISQSSFSTAPASSSDEAVDGDPYNSILTVVGRRRIVDGVEQRKIRAVCCGCLPREVGSCEYTRTGSIRKISALCCNCLPGGFGFCTSSCQINPNRCCAIL